MMLSDRDIRDALNRAEFEREIDIDTGECEIYIGPSSVDLHLDNKAIIEQKDGRFKNYDDWEELVINPGEFYILSTVEKIRLGRSMAAFVQGRSSWAREGLNVHLAGFVDPGFEGNITLEVTNFKRNPITLKKHDRVCQLVFMRTNSPVEVSYAEKPDAKYYKQVGPTLRRKEITNE